MLTLWLKVAFHQFMITEHSWKGPGSFQSVTYELGAAVHNEEQQTEQKTADTTERI